MRVSRTHVLRNASAAILVAVTVLVGIVHSRGAHGQALEVPTTQATRNAAPAVAVATTAPARAPNPHWIADGCRYCHKIENGKAIPIPPRDVDALCEDCHDGERARRERHPVQRLFISEQVVQPPGWPTIDGKLGCETCHQHILACRLATRLRAGNKDFLRGFEGGRLLEFCSRCHVETGHHRYKLHEMLTPDGETIESKCRFCHTGLLDQRDRMTRTGNAELRADVITLCEGCHMQHVDFFEPGHIGVKVKPEMKAYMAAFDSISGPPWRRPGPKEIEEALRSKREPIRLPLDSGDRLVCSTCHNPHQEGVFPRGSVLAYGAVEPEAMPRTRHLRGLGKEICVACHNK